MSVGKTLDPGILFSRAIEKALRSEVERKIEDMSVEIQQMLQKKVGHIVLGLLKQYSVTALGDEITIRVQITDKR